MTRVAIVIPARYASTRFPGKPLADLLGKPMIQHTWERARAIDGADTIIVATDDQRIADVVTAFGGVAVMTRTDHPSGTDRLVEVMGSIEADLYVNIQGDEPLIDTEAVSRLVAAMRADATIQVGTLCHAIDAREAQNPNSVKVVRAANDDALYFSRSPIPFVRDAGVAAGYLKHVGVYAYRRDVLANYSALERPEIETVEQLEQLRLLAAGIRIRVMMSDVAAPGVDTPACLERVTDLLSGRAPRSEGPDLSKVRLVITDVDGVLTDGGLYYDGEGEALKRFHVRDGLGIKRLKDHGVAVAALSGRDSPALRRRLQELGVERAVFGAHEKGAAAHSLIAAAGVTSAEAIFVGDDLIDLPGFDACAFGVAVADAVDEVRAQAAIVLESKGGMGAFRELADKIVAAQQIICNNA